MTDDAAPRVQYGEAFWQAHHEAWKRSDLNQREYCEVQGLSLKTLPQPPAHKLLYRRGGVSHALGHSLSHVTYPSSTPAPDPIVLPAQAGHWRVDYNEVRPHSAIGQKTPAEYARASGQACLP